MVVVDSMKKTSINDSFNAINTINSIDEESLAAINEDQQVVFSEVVLSQWLTIQMSLILELGHQVRSSTNQKKGELWSNRKASCNQ